MANTPQHAADRGAETTQPVLCPSPLAPIFYPATVAVIGATDKPASVGRTVLRNLMEQPSGATIFPINPHRTNVLGIRCYANVAAIGERVDLALVITPAATVPEVLRECVEAGVRSAIVISAGFAELGPAGQQREHEIKQVLSSSHLRLIGPNCLGIMNPRTGLNATFAQANALPGNIAFLSQSGALCTAILDWSRRENVGFSGFVSVGSMLDVSWGDLIYHFGDDAYTSSILIIYGVHRRCPQLSLCGARGLLAQTDYRHQAGAKRSRAKGGGFPHRSPDRLG